MKKSQLDNICFPPEFFEDEVREGFLITTMVKRYWAAQLKMLSLIEKICSKYDIKWFADCGTLLGAVRHEGFIPWDDDLDICMLRSEWERFFEVAKKELPKDFVVLTPKEQPEYRQIIGRIVDSRSIDYSAEHMKEYCGCPYTVGVDIFPLDNLYDDEIKEKDRIERLLKAADAYNDNETRSGLLRVEEICRECPDEKSSKVTLMTVHMTQNDHIYGKELFDAWVELPFENTFIRVPARYEEVLAIEYYDYMKVFKAGGVHEYPAFAAQEKVFKKQLGRNPLRYTFDNKELLHAVGRYVRKIAASKQVPREYEKVLFLPCRAKWWPSMEGLWREMKEDPAREVHVAPLPYYYRDFDGEILGKNYEGTMFPESVCAENIQEIDLQKERFDKIVIQVPYDGWSVSLSVPEQFYSGNLIGLTDELFYVPFFDVDDSEEDGDKASVALSIMAEQPAVINADKVILKTQRMKDVYMKKLIELSGEETQSYWNQKLVVKELSAAGGIIDAAIDIQENENVDETWWNEFVMKHPDKKIMVYYITISFLLKGGHRSIDKIKDSVKVFEENTDKVAVIVLPHKVIEAELQGIDGGLWQEYEDLMTEIGSSENLVIDRDGRSLAFVDKWDGLYGDTGSIPRVCAERHIPVMIQNLEVCSCG